MGLYEQLELKIPKANPNGWVSGKEFNRAIGDLLNIIRRQQNLGAYLVHPDEVSGSFPSISSAIGQAAQEVPNGQPLVIGILPNADFDEDVVVPASAVENHDIYFMNQFEDYDDQEGTVEWRGSLTLPAVSAWPSGRKKMVNMFGMSTKNFDINMNSGWIMNLRRSQMNNLTLSRTHGVNGARVWSHDSIFSGNFSMRDLDSMGSGNSQIIFSHCAMNCGDNPAPSFLLDGSYQVWFIQSWLTAFLSTGAGLFDLRPPIGSYSGTLQFVDTTIECWVVANTKLIADASNANCKWQGMNTVEVINGNPTTFDLGGFNSVAGFPYCRLKGTMPTNPPNGCRASDDKVDYRDKVWSGSAWV